jgi:UDP-glucose 4-epimerase
MKVAVTGGSGFIGSHVVDHLIAAGHDVVVFDHRVKPHRPDVKFEDIDILEESSLISATKGLDAIFHLAAVSNVDYAFKFPVYSVNLNILGTTKVLEAARVNGLKQVIFASTVWVYTGCRDTGMLTEETPFYLPDAGHVYTSSKIAAEMIIHNYAALYGQKFTILRYGIPFGPRMREELVIPIFVRRALKGEPLMIKGSGNQYRNYIYIDDLARFHTLVLENEKAINQVYNLEGPDPITIRQIAETIRDIIGSNIRVEVTEQRAGDYAGKTASAEKAKRELDWAPAIDFKTGMQRYIEWYRSNSFPKVTGAAR